MTSFTRFLARSLALLEDEVQEAYESTARHLDGRVVRLEVDGEVLSVCGREGRLRLRPGDAEHDVDLRTTREVIGSLIDGDFTLLDAILANRVTLRGAVDDLVRFDAGLLAYLNGAVRCPEFPALRDAYLGPDASQAATRRSTRHGVHHA